MSMPDEKPIRRAGDNDISPAFTGVPDRRRCAHCYIGSRHSTAMHERMIKFYEDDADAG